MLNSRLMVRGWAGILLLACLACSHRCEALQPTAEQATEWLRRYVSIDSSTLPGTLTATAFLRDLLHQEGVATRWIVSPQGQPFLHATTAVGRPAREAVLLLHHTDVVPAGTDWTRSPYAAEIEDGALFGRGTIDDKSLGIAHLVSFLRFRNLTAAPQRDLVLLAVSGEEKGGEQGLDWLLDNHPELLDGIDAVLTEGGANRTIGPQLSWWGIEVAQKRPLWLSARASGRGGHGSSINLYSAPHRLIRGLARLVDRPRRYRLTAEARDFLESVSPLESSVFQEIVSDLDETLHQPEPERHLLPGLPAYLLDTIQVNSLASGDRVNVTPAEATALIDVRLLPDTDAQTFLQELRDLVGEEVTLEVLLDSPRVTPSPTDHPVFECLERTLGHRAPVVPAFITAITDARLVRARGVAAYGLSPFVLDASELRGIHGPDEHISLAAFSSGVETLWSVVKECTGG